MMELNEILYLISRTDFDNMLQTAYWKGSNSPYPRESDVVIRKNWKDRQNMDIYEIKKDNQEKISQHSMNISLSQRNEGIY